MTKIKYITGDLLQADEQIIVHGCNAQGVMGSGIAKAIRDRYPDCYDTYKAAYDTRGLKTGEVIWWSNDDLVVANAITQQFYGRDETIRYCSYDAIASCVALIDQIAAGVSVAFPLIGAGLANGDWNVIAAIIESEAKSFEPVVYRLPN